MVNEMCAGKKSAVVLLWQLQSVMRFETISRQKKIRKCSYSSFLEMRGIIYQA